jgi:type IV pilus assembly protein PilW
MRPIGNNKAQEGLTLVEVMIAMVLGLLVTAAVLSMYLGTSRNFSQDERYAFLQENGRYALKALSEDVGMADFWGPLVNTDTLSASFTPASGGCADAIAIFDATPGLRFNDNHPTSPVPQFTPCTTVTAHHLATTDVLVVKRVRGAPVAETFIDVSDVDEDGNTTEQITQGSGDLQNGTVYVRTNGTTGSFIQDASSSNAPALGEADWEYMPRLYFVRDYYETVGDGVPALCRLDIHGVELNDLDCIAEGVQDLHFQFGLDTNRDGLADQYIASPTDSQMSQVVTARIYLLVRSSQPDNFYTNNKTYQLGDVGVGPFNDGYYRRVFTTTVAVRNVSIKNLIDAL